MDILAVLRDDKSVISYKPRLREIAGSATATILLQQIIFLDHGKEKIGQDKFYKFRAPCGHRLCIKGDSWCEVLGFSKDEFDTAIKKIGVKISKAKPLPEGSRPLVTYWIDTDHITWYKLDRDLMRQKLEELYTPKESAEENFPKLGFPIQLNEESQSRRVTENTTYKEKKRKKGDDSIVVENGKFVGDIQVLRDVVFAHSSILDGHKHLLNEVFPVLLEQLQLPFWKTQAEGVNAYKSLERYFLKRYGSKPKYWIFDYRSYTLWYYAGLPGGLPDYSSKLEAQLSNLTQALKTEGRHISIKEYAEWYAGYAVERDWVPGWNSALSSGVIGIFVSEYLEEQFSSSSRL